MTAPNGLEGLWRFTGQIFMMSEGNYDNFFVIMQDN